MYWISKTIYLYAINVHLLKHLYCEYRLLRTARCGRPILCFFHNALIANYIQTTFIQDFLVSLKRYIFPGNIFLSYMHNDVCNYSKLHCSKLHVYVTRYITLIRYTYMLHVYVTRIGYMLRYTYTLHLYVTRIRYTYTLHVTLHVYVTLYVTLSRIQNIIKGKTWNAVFVIGYMEKYLIIFTITTCIWISVTPTYKPTPMLTSPSSTST